MIEVVDTVSSTLEVEVKLARLVLPALICICLAPSQRAHSVPHSVPQAGRLPLPAPSGPLEFEPGTEEIGIDELLARFARLTGQELVMTMRTRQVLAQIREPLESTAPVPKEEVYTFVESLLARQAVVIAPLSGGTRPILGVQALESVGEVPLAPLHVEREALSELALHPALLVRMLLNLENTDTRQLQTQLRQLQTDTAGANQFVPLGDRGLIVQGRAKEMASLVRMLVEADEAQGRRPAPAPEAEKKGE